MAPIEHGIKVCFEILKSFPKHTEPDILLTPELFELQCRFNWPRF